MFNIETSQGIVNIMIPDTVVRSNVDRPVTRVGIKLSGGADSAIMTYALALCKKQFKPEIELIPITSVNPNKPCQHIYANRVLSKITQLTDVTFGYHHIQYARLDIEFIQEQTTFINKMYEDDIFDCHFLGETLNPDVNDQSFELIRTDSLTEFSRNFKGENIVKNSYRPFRNINKKAIKEIYEYFNVLKELFPITRSCEYKVKPTSSFDWYEKHCGECWFCNERLWGFGRYV